MQKGGICIGSSIVPLLTDIYLNTLDLALLDHANSCQPNSFLITRYVDDIMIGTINKTEICRVREHAHKSSPELTFTTEEPSNGSLQYLDLKLLTTRGLWTS